LESANPKKHNLKALLVIVIIVVAAVAGAYYYISIPRAPPRFTFVSSPPFFHVVAGLGQLIMINVTRQPGFTAAVNVTVANAPAWLTYWPTSIPTSSSAGTLGVVTAKSAPKGVTPLTILATAPGSASQTATVQMRIAGSHNFTSSAGTGEVYDTTKQLDEETIQALVSYVNGTATFSQSTPQLQNLQVGDVILLHPGKSTVAPKGFSRVVMNVQNSGGQVLVSTRQANLLDVFVVLKIGTPTQATNSTTSMSGTSVQSIGVQGGKPSTCQGGNVYWLYPSSGQFTWNETVTMGGFKVTAQLTYGVCLHYGASISVHWGGCVLGVCLVPEPGVDYVELTLQGFAGAAIDFIGQANTPISYGPKDIDDLVDASIDILPLLWIDVHLYVEAYGTGQIGSHSFDLNAHANVWMIEGPVYENGGWTWMNNVGKDFACDFCSMDFATVEKLEGTTVRFGIGPRLDSDVDSGLVSADFAFHGFLEFDVGYVPSNPMWMLSGGLDSMVNIGGFWGLVSWDTGCCTNSNNVFSFDIFKSPNYPPPTPVLLISAGTIDLSNPNFLDPNMLKGWVGDVPGPDPQGESVTCIWDSAELGRLGTQSATEASNGGSWWCKDPPPSMLPVDEIISKGLTTLTLTVVAVDSAGSESSPSNAVSVNILFPTPTLRILCAPCNSQSGTITQNQPFAVVGEGQIAVLANSAYPNGVDDLCNTAPQRLQWSIDYAALGNNPSGCSATLTITTPGQHLILFFLLTPDLSNMATDGKGNFYIASVTVTVQAQTSTPPPPPTPSQGGLRVMITSPGPTQYSGSAGITPSSGPIYLTGLDLTPAPPMTPPITFTWYAQYLSQTVTITTTGPGNLVISQYTWKVCNTFYNEQGMASVYLKATDAANHEGSAGPVYVSFNCEVAQAFPPFSVAMVSLLTVLFAVTGDQFIVKVRNAPWLRGRWFPEPLKFAYEYGLQIGLQIANHRGRLRN
jgi:hypothetical protein